MTLEELIDALPRSQHVVIFDDTKQQRIFTGHAAELKAKIWILEGYVVWVICTEVNPYDSVDYLVIHISYQNEPDPKDRKEKENGKVFNR